MMWVATERREAHARCCVVVEQLLATDVFDQAPSVQSTIAMNLVDFDDANYDDDCVYAECAAVRAAYERFLEFYLSSDFHHAAVLSDEYGAPPCSGAPMTAGRPRRKNKFARIAPVSTQSCISLHLPNGHMQNIEVHANGAVLDLKRAFNNISGMLVRMQMLKFGGRVLIDAASLRDCGIQDSDVIELHFSST